MPKVLYNRTVVLDDDGKVLMWDAHKVQRWGMWVYIQPGVNEIVDATGIDLGEQIRSWRERQGLTLKDVAEKLGVSLSIVSLWERGLRTPRGAKRDRIEAMLAE